MSSDIMARGRRVPVEDRLRRAILDLTHDVASARGSETDSLRQARDEIAPGCHGAVRRSTSRRS